MNKIAVFPKNLEEKNEILSFLKSKNIKFDSSEDEISEMKLDDDFLTSMETSFRTVMSDKIAMREFDLNN